MQQDIKCNLSTRASGSPYIYQREPVAVCIFINESQWQSVYLSTRASGSPHKVWISYGDELQINYSIF